MIFKSIIILFTTLSLSFQYTQQSPQQESIVENSNIMVVNKLKNTWYCGSPAQLEKAFGKTKIKKESDEASGGFGYTYAYKGLKVYFNEKECESVTITSPEYQIVLNGRAYTVGEPILKLKDSFPASYKNIRKDGIRLAIAHSRKITDAYIFFSYNTKGIITDIEIANDNS